MNLHSTMYVIDAETWRWSRSVLCCRTQCVVVDGKASEEIEYNLQGTTGLRSRADGLPDLHKLRDRVSQTILSQTIF